MARLRRPCDNCPWRVDAPRNYWHPDHFTAIWQNCQDDGPHLMMCHKTNNQTPEQKATNELICQGWVRVMGDRAIGVRFALLTGKVTADELLDVKGPKLFTGFKAMMKANGIPLPKRNKLIPVHLLSARMRKR